MTRGDEPLHVTGGAGGTAADLEAVHAAACGLRAVGDELDDVGGRLAGAVSDPALLPGSLVDPVGWAGVQAALVPLVAGCLLAGARVNALGVGAAAAAHAYATADAGAERLVVGARDAVAGRVGRLGLRMALTPWGWLAALVPVTGWVALRSLPLVAAEQRRLVDDVRSGRFTLDTVDDRVLRLGVLQLGVLGADVRDAAATAAGWAVAHPEAAQHLVGGLPAAFSGFAGWPMSAAAPDALPFGRTLRTPAELALLASLVALVVVPGSGDLGVRVRQTAATRPVAAPAGVADLLARAVPGNATGHPAGVGAAAGAGAAAGVGAGRVRVDRLDGARGTAWVVTLPGTQTWSVAGSRSPFDATSNAHLMAGVPAASSRAAVEAMHAAGVRPGQPVLLVGHSQGGLTALQMAADPAVRQRYDVATVLTAGAPVGGLEVPRDVQVLSLEHRQDLVVAADGTDNPDHPAWTTVRRDLLVGSPVDAGADSPAPGGAGAAHGLTSYLGTARLVDRSAEESVLAWVRAAEPFLAAPGTVATATEYAAVRRPGT